MSKTFFKTAIATIITVFNLSILIGYSVANSKELGKEHSLSETILRKYFSNFSTSPTFVLIKIQNESDAKTAFIVYENPEWFEIISNLPGYFIHDEKEYVEFMVQKYGQPFVFPEKTYNRMILYYGAPAAEEYEIARKNGIRNIVEKYLQKREHRYLIRDIKRYRDRSFIRMFLEMGLVVMRDCYSGDMYVDYEETEAQLEK